MRRASTPSTNRLIRGTTGCARTTDGLWNEIPKPNLPSVRVAAPSAGPGQIVATITALLQHLVFVHAGVVAINGRACVIVGDSGAGKTSTVGALVARGAAYLSDEVALLDPDTNCVVPLHLPLTIKPWTARATGPLPPGTDVARQGAVIFRLPVRLGQACPLGTVVLLERGSRPMITEVSRPQALLRLARQPSSFQHASRTDGTFRAWARGLRSARCLELGAERPAALAPALMNGLSRNP